MNYRIYLLDGAGRIRAAESFSAAADVEAVRVAASVHNACSDIFHGYEVWRGTERLAGSVGNRANGATLNVWDVVMTRQENILDLEDRLQSTFSCVKESRRLLEVSARLRELWHP